MEKLPAKRGGYRPGSGRKPTVITDDDRNRILDAYIETPNQKKVAAKLNYPVWTVVRVLGEQPPSFRFGVLQTHTYETLHGTLDKIQALLSKVTAHHGFPDLYRTFGALIKGLTELETGGAVRGPKNAMQTIVNITTDEATRLKQTMDTVEGEVVDHSDA